MHVRHLVPPRPTSRRRYDVTDGFCELRSGWYRPKLPQTGRRRAAMRRAPRADSRGARFGNALGGQDVLHGAIRDESAGVGGARGGEIHFRDSDVWTGDAGHPRDMTVCPCPVLGGLEHRY